MSEPPPGIGQGSAPVAIILALALAATVGVSAQSWDVKAVPKQTAGTPQPAGPAGVATPADDLDSASLLRLVANWFARARSIDCTAPTR